MKKKKTKKKKLLNKKKCNIKLIKCVLFGFILILTFSSYMYCNYKVKKEYKEEKKRIEDNKNSLINNIKSNYDSTVITNKDLILYSFVDNEYIETGSVKEGIELDLGSIEIDENTKYFPVTTFGDIYYVKYTDVSIREELLDDELGNTSSKRYKKYIPFDKNAVTTNITKLYKDDVLVYNLPISINSPIYKIDGDKYYIEYNNELYYVLNEDITLIDSNNSDEPMTTGITTIAYHFFYEDNDWSGCAQVICTSESLFRKQLDYLKDNNYLTLTMSEFEDWIDKKINLPKNTVVLTIDDGWRSSLGVEILNEYGMNATLFLISKSYPSTMAWGTVEAGSHSENLHNQGDCPTGQGGGIQCLSEDILLKDLETSRSKLNNTTIFCYPFYEYNDYAISILKRAGFTMAFAGVYSNGSLKMHQGDNKYLIPRITFINTTTVEDLKNVL